MKLLLAGVVVWAIAAGCFFRQTLMSSFDLIFGDRGDARMIVYLHEHLFQSLLGNATFLSPAFFYPQANVLGFTDAFLLDAMPYAVLRAFGCDPFLSIQIEFIALSLSCFMASLVICARYLKVRPVISLCAAALITFPNNLLYKTAIGHIVFFALYYVPIIVVLVLWGLETFPRPTVWSHVRVGAAAALLGLLFATSYYIGWMFVFTALIAACATAVILRSSLTIAIRENIRPICTLGVVAFFALCLAIIPFAIIYVPVLLIVGGRGYRDYITFAPQLQDLINVSSWNLVWGWLVDLLPVDRGAETSLMVTPGMTAIFLALAWRLRIVPTGAASWQVTFATACIAVFAASALATVKIGTVSSFWLVHYVVPGAAAIRAGGRIQLLVNIWIVLGLAVVLDWWLTAANCADRSHRKLAVGGLLLFCLVEQVNTVPTSLSRAYELGWLSEVPNPPESCEVFLVNVPQPPPHATDQVDAMWISWKVSRPTLNGDSGWWPPGWRIDRRSNDYFDGAREWIERTGLKAQICLYDRAARRWSAFR